MTLASIAEVTSAEATESAVYFECKRLPSSAESVENKI